MQKISNVIITEKNMEKNNIPKVCWPNHPLAQPFGWFPLTVPLAPDVPVPRHKLCCCRANNRTVKQYVINITSNGM